MGLTVALTGCGGGGSGQAPSTLNNVVGIWRDNTSTRPTQAGLILPNGAYWAFYEAAGSEMAGFEQGSASATGTDFQAATKEYPNGLQARDVKISAAFSNAEISGRRTINNTLQQNFVLTRLPSNEQLAPQVRVSDIEGTWAGSLSGSPATLLVPPNSPGDFSGSGGSSGCNFTGTLVPQSNAYALDVTLTFSGCSLAGVIAQGVATAYTINNGAQKQLLIAVQNQDRSKGWLFSATQP
ncbi:MAG: hypothetical protein RL559_231 [Pseudomonadota bacterium]|jgi:hypothetical protein